MGIVQQLAREAITTLGLEGVSTVALLVAVSVALYAHKASSAGRKVVYMGSTAQHDLKVAALVIAGLLVLGVLSADVQRSRELIHVVGQRLAQLPVEQWIERVT